MEPFTLRDGDLELSTPTPADVDRVTEICQDPEIQRWTTVPSPYRREDAVDFIGGYVSDGWERGDSLSWAVRCGDRLVGMAGLVGTGGSVELGYWLAPEARGAGLMTRAVGLVLDVAFDRLAAERVEWRADVGNWTSWRVAWRHGFRREGQVRGLGDQRGRRVDQWIGTLLRDDPREPAAPWDGPGVPDAPVPRAAVPGAAVPGAAVPGAAVPDAAVPDAAVPPAPPSPAATPLAPPDGERPDALVREFHERFRVPIADDAPSVDRDRVHLRMALVAEEFAELVTAVYGTTAGEEVTAAVERAVAADDGARDTVASADALADLVYVLYGMAEECGIPLPAVLAEVHAANLSKLGPDDTPLLREDGKVLKAPGYRPPDVVGVLAGHRDAGHGETMAP